MLHIPDLSLHENATPEEKVRIAEWVLADFETNNGQEVLQTQGDLKEENFILELWVPKSCGYTEIVRFCSCKLYHNSDYEDITLKMLRAFMISLGGDYIVFNPPSKGAFWALHTAHC